MRPTSLLAGASRLPLSGKRANKDFYKGTGQSRVPGSSRKTGPPGVFVVRGKAKYRLVDTQVRVFVGPGQQAMEETELKPYVATRDESDPDHKTFFNPFARGKIVRPVLPTFSPNAQPSTPESSLSRRDYAKFSKKWAHLTGEEKQWLIMEQRRKWWQGMEELYHRDGVQSASIETPAAPEAQGKEEAPAA